jgi:hypothetical protein
MRRRLLPLGVDVGNSAWTLLWLLARLEWEWQDADLGWALRCMHKVPELLTDGGLDYK